MLMLSRRVGESIMIGEDVRVVIVSQVGSHIKVGIEAPRDIAVHREEVFKRLAEEKHGRTRSPA